MSNQKITAGSHVKDPVTTAYPGKVPKDSETIRHGNVKAEVTPASTAPQDPATGNLIINNMSTNKITRDIDEWGAENGEQSQISTTAGATLGGATSKDVNRGLGAPVQGETSAELHHDGQRHRKRQCEGVVQYGPQAGPLNLGQSHNSMKECQLEPTQDVNT